jgi:hypothetical protein
MRVFYRYLTSVTAMALKRPPVEPLVVILGSTGTGKSEV